MVQTQRHDNTLNPCFNETHIMTWDGKNDLVCAVFDHDVHSSDDNLGKLTIPLTNFDWLSGKVFKLHDIPLTNTDRGTISLEIRYNIPTYIHPYLYSHINEYTHTYNYAHTVSLVPSLVWRGD